MKSGTALPVVLFALSLTSGLVVSGVFVSRRLVAGDRVIERSIALEPAFDRALITALTDWDSTAMAVQPVGVAQTIPLASVSGPGASAWITRIGQRMYWVVAEARDESSPSIRRRVGVVVRVSNGAPSLVPERAWSELP